VTVPRCKISRPQVLAFIALGANLGDAKGNVVAAIQAVSKLPDTQVLRVSSLYRTAPVEAIGPDFVNAVMGILTTLDAYELLSQLKRLENTAGRQRLFRNAPRTLDLDILLYGGACIDSVDLQVPHPRMFERAFVLLPLAEIAPEKVTADQLAAVAGQVIERLESD